MGGRPTGRHVGRVGPRLRDVPGPGPAGVPPHQLRGMRLPLGECAQVPQQAARLLQRHMAAGRFLQGAPSDRCSALVSLGGRLCAGPRARPFSAARADMALQLQGLALHLQEAWLHRLRTPARIRPGGGDTLPHNLFP